MQTVILKSSQVLASLSLSYRTEHSLLPVAGQQEHWRHEQGKMRTPPHTRSDMDHIT